MNNEMVIRVKIRKFVREQSAWRGAQSVVK